MWDLVKAALTRRIHESILSLSKGGRSGRRRDSVFCLWFWAVCSIAATTRALIDSGSMIAGNVKTVSSRSRGDGDGERRW